MKVIKKRYNELKKEGIKRQAIINRLCKEFTMTQKEIENALASSI